MAKDVKFTIKLAIDGKEQIVTASVNSKELAEQLVNVQQESDKLRDKLIKATQIGASFKNVVSGLQQLVGVMQTYTSANAAQVEVETKLANNMRNTMGARDEDIQSIKDLCSAQQEQGVIGDEVQLAGAQELATYLEKKSSLEKLIPVMNDMLAQQYGLNATQESAANIATMLGKVMDGQTGALSRYGYKFDEAQEQILKFGTEEQRAAVLADVVSSAVGGMNEELAKTDAGKAKQLANTLGDMKEWFGSLLESIEPTISAANELGGAAMGVCTAWQGIKGITIAITGFSSAIKTSIVATYAQAAASKVASAAQALWANQVKFANRMQIAWTFGAKKFVIQAVAMRVAIMGLMAVTGVGLAIMAVSGIISLFASKTDDATDSLKNYNREQKNAEEAASRQKDMETATTDAYSNAAASLDIYKEKLKNLIDAKQTGKDISTEEKKIVGQLNDTYGDTMGYFDSVTKWYDALIQNSEAYCRQMVIEAKTRTLANQIAEKEAETHNLIYDDKGNKKLYSTKREIGQRQRKINPNNAMTALYQSGINSVEYFEIEGTSELDKVNQKIRDNQAVVANLKKQMQDAVKEAGQIEFKVQGTATRTDTDKNKNKGGKTEKTLTEKTLIENALTYKELTNNVSYYQQELEKCDITDTERIATLSRAKKAAEDAVQAFKNLTEAASLPAETATLDDYDKKLQHLRKQRQTATGEAIAGIDAEIRETEAARQALEDMSVAAVRDDEITTYDQLNDKLAYYNRLLNSGDEAQRQMAQKGINGLNKLQEAWKETLDGMSLPTSPDTLQDIDAAISFYSARQQKEDADQIARTQAIIDGLKAKRTALEIGIELPSMQKEAAEINALTGREYRMKVSGYGFDELTAKIKELQKLLADTENPVTDGQRKEIESLIGTYEKWRSESVMSFDTLKSGWSGVKGIGDGVQSITDALEGNAGAWQTVTGLVDGFIQLYESLQAVTGIINMITQATKTKTTQTVADTIATETNTITTEVNTMESVKNTAAKSGEAIGNATASGAKLPFPYNLAAIAAGVAAVVAALAMIGSFSTGGIVGGSSPTGDRLLARVNSGEMILNRRQQQRLLALLSGGLTVSHGLTRDTVRGGMRHDSITLDTDGLHAMLRPAGGTGGGKVKFEINGRKLVGVMANETRIGSKSGRRTQIKI